MIFGAMIIGVGIGLVGMIVPIVADADVMSVLLTYWLVSCTGTAGVIVIKALFCRVDRKETSSSAQSLQ